MWQLFGAANILNCCIRSIYPEAGYTQPTEPILTYHDIMDRTIMPEKGSTAEVAIMWTSNREDMPKEHWVANHIIPLLPVRLDALCQGATADLPPSQEEIVEHTATESSEKVATSRAERTEGVLDEFFQMLWSDGKTYVCQVRAIEDDHVNVHFMSRDDDGNLYSWSKPDHSWEPIDWFLARSEPVRLSLCAEHSNQRKQYFRIEQH